ncbi:MAG: DUF5979 domain-containing protein [Dehalococcoidia bacterium]|nr:DUF5979 domain-containing protein [Dehalococcoidia bacterium]
MTRRPSRFASKVPPIPAATARPGTTTAEPTPGTTSSPADTRSRSPASIPRCGPSPALGLPTVTVEGGETATHPITNTRLSGDISITKTVDADGGVAGDWAFEACVFEGTDTAADPLACVSLDEASPTKSIDGLAPGAYTVVETPNDDYTTTVRVNGGDPVESGEVEVTVADGQAANVEFTNTLRPGQLIVEKRYGASFDTATCDSPSEADWPSITVDGTALDDGDGCEWGPVGIGANVDHEVDETPADGWTLAGLEYTEECRVGFTGDNALDSALRLVDRVPGVDIGVLLGSTLAVNVAPGETCTVTYLNEPVGDAVVVKIDEVPGEGSQDWTFSDGGAPSGDIVLTTLPNPGGDAVESRRDHRRRARWGRPRRGRD